ncbi:MAG: efflux RND transporter periplasmic adaptor subunit [Rhodocyclaceae bacterium]|nr:efflux RND transporter periplasmic adaptor subunit [Rhodocyclaceae bacterium]
MTPRPVFSPMRSLLRGIRVTASVAALLLPLSVAAQAPAPVEIVTLAAAQGGGALDLTGSVTAQRRAELSPRVSGLVSRIRADVGDRVRAGEPLLELDDALARLAHQRDQAQLEEARTRVREAERLHAENRSLVDRKFLPETRLLASQAEVDIARAAAGRLEAQLKESAERVSRHRVAAPFDGVIAQRMAELGEWVDTGDGLFELVALSPLRIDVQMPQERFADVRPGTPVTVLPDALPGTRLTGRIGARVPVGDAVARTFLVRILVEDPDERIVPGMSAHVRFELADAAPGVSVPRDALVRSVDGQAEVWLAAASDDGKAVARKRSVVAGRSLGDRVAIESGLAPGDRIIVRGNERLRDGQPLRVVAER